MRRIDQLIRWSTVGLLGVALFVSAERLVELRGFDDRLDDIERRPTPSTTITTTTTTTETAKVLADIDALAAEPLGRRQRKRLDAARFRATPAPTIRFVAGDRMDTTGETLRVPPGAGVDVVIENVTGRHLRNIRITVDDRPRLVLLAVIESPHVHRLAAPTHTAQSVIVTACNDVGKESRVEVELLATMPRIIGVVDGADRHPLDRTITVADGASLAIEVADLESSVALCVVDVENGAKLARLVADTVVDARIWSGKVRADAGDVKAKERQVVIRLGSWSPGELELGHLTLRVDTVAPEVRVQDEAAENVDLDGSLVRGTKGATFALLIEDDTNLVKVDVRSEPFGVVQLAPVERSGVTSYRREFTLCGSGRIKVLARDAVGRETRKSLRVEISPR